MKRPPGRRSKTIECCWGKKYGLESCKKRILNEENDAQSSVRYGGSLGVVFLPQFFGAKVEEKEGILRKNGWGCRF